MARYPLNLPIALKRDAEEWADRQGVSLNQFIVWAVSEKVGGLKVDLHDPRFPGVEYRSGAAGRPTPVLRGTGIRVQTLAIASTRWEMVAEEIAEEWDLSPTEVREALDFYAAHRAEIDSVIEEEVRAEARAEREVA